MCGTSINSSGCVEPESERGGIGELSEISLQGLRSQVSGSVFLSWQIRLATGMRADTGQRLLHANLAVNASFTLCEFLLDSFEYQKERKKRGLC
jgi:hypothetical protein